MSTTKPIVRLLLIALAATALRGQNFENSISEFMDRKVTITEAEKDARDFPKGPATICLEGPPKRQCFAPPRDFGLVPTAEVVQLKDGIPALLFSAATGAGSGFGIHFALLRPGDQDGLEDLFRGGIGATNLSETDFWNDPAISDAAIFVVADAVWGDEGHYNAHRYIVSAYTFRDSDLIPGSAFYFLEDQYLTARKYQIAGPDASDHVLDSERHEILARLRQVKAEREKAKR